MVKDEFGGSFDQNFVAQEEGYDFLGADFVDLQAGQDFVGRPERSPPRRGFAGSICPALFVWGARRPP